MSERRGRNVGERMSWGLGSRQREREKSKTTIYVIKLSFKVVG